MAPLASTARFGDVTYALEDVILLPRGLPPFLDARRFVLVSNAEEEPFVWLQSLDDPGLALALGPLDVLFPDHAAQIRAAMSDCGENGGATPCGLYGVIVLHPDPAQMTINLAAPIVIDFARRRAEQLVIDAPTDMTRTPLVEAIDSPPPS